MTIVIYGFFAIVFATITSITLVLLARKRLPQEVQGRHAFLTIWASLHLPEYSGSLQRFSFML